MLVEPSIETTLILLATVVYQAIENYKLTKQIKVLEDVEKNNRPND